MNKNEENEKVNKNSSTFVVVIVVLILLLGIGGYYFYKLRTSSSGEWGKFEEDYISDSDCGCQSGYDDTATPVSTSVTNDSQVLEEYINLRYGFEIIPPQDFLSFESENGDGVTYTHSDAVTIRVFGANNSEGLTLDQYLDKETTQLKMETGDAEEIGINEVNLDGCEGERRVWEYTSPIDGTKTIKERVMCLDDDVFYIIDFESSKDVYDQYSSIFDDIIFSYQLK